MSWSIQLFGQKLIEFDRLVSAIFLKDLIFEGSYQAYLQFTAEQNPADKLSWEHFCELNKLATGLSESYPQNELKRLVNTALILHDIRKCKKAREKIEELTRCPLPEDHDQFYSAYLMYIENNVSLSPSFHKLKTNDQKLLIHTS